MSANQGSPHSGDDRADDKRNKEHGNSVPRDIHSVEANPEAKASDDEGHGKESKSYEKTIARWTVALGVSTVILAIATIASAVFMWRTMVNGQRAYVMIDESAVSDFLEGRTPVAELKIKNFGLTPAHAVRISGRIRIEKNPSPLEQPPRLPALIAPGGHNVYRVTYDWPITKEQREAVISGELSIFVIGRITYIDAFGCARETQFSRYFRGNRGPVGSSLPLADTETGNRAN